MSYLPKTQKQYEKDLQETRVFLWKTRALFWAAMLVAVLVALFVHVVNADAAQAEAMVRYMIDGMP
jgi:hypothetical protein